MSNYKVDLEKIKGLAFDLDGVFTNGTVLATEEGHLLRVHNAKDGYALKVALDNNYPIAIITGGTDKSIVKRFERLGLEDIYLASHNKLPDFLHFCDKYSLTPDQVLFMGDDIPDIAVLERCGLPCAPADAVEEVKRASRFISSYQGGKGCVREIIEQFLKIKGEWNF
ncbi:MAG: HAD hydrolase family protein [Bacteroidales bacterium]